MGWGNVSHNFGGYSTFHTSSPIFIRFGGHSRRKFNVNKAMSPKDSWMFPVNEIIEFFRSSCLMLRLPTNRPMGISKKTIFPIQLNHLDESPNIILSYAAKPAKPVHLKFNRLK